jgi:hypothetical protein
MVRSLRMLAVARFKALGNFNQGILYPGRGSNRAGAVAQLVCVMARGTFSFENLGFHCQQLLHLSLSTYGGCSRPYRS